MNQTFAYASNSIKNQIGKLDRELESALELIINKKRLIITCGVGKSGHIASKVAATLTSTGNPAIHLNPLDATHGDLGVIQNGDIMLMFSNSGESRELISIIPTLKQRKVPIISIVGRENSSLSAFSDASIIGKIDKEACPLNLAPTTSTTLAMTIGDALAVGLMVHDDYQPKDFALNHPAGSLGRRLTLKVEDIIKNTSSSLSADKNSSFIELVCKISKSGCGAICITDENGTIIGIVTDGDIRRTVEHYNPDEFGSITAGEIMSKEPERIKSGDLAINALNIMENRKSQISVLAVTDKENKFFGLIRIHDLIQAGL